LGIIFTTNYIHKGIILKNIYDIAIIGAGASGMVASINLAQNGKKVALIERQNRGGKKILASGNGHCNIGNLNVNSSDYFAQNKELIKTVLANFSVDDVVDFFNKLGLEIVAKDDGKLFPKSMQASSVLNLLEAKVKSLNIDTFYNVQDLKVQKGFKLSFNKNSINAKKLIVATGSLAAPQLGATNFGLEIAKSFGHNIIKPLPALVPLVSRDKICKVLNGVKLHCNLKLLINNQEKTSLRGDILFRDYGISGLGVLDLSLYCVDVIDRGQSVEIVVDFLSEYNKKSALEFFKSRVDRDRNLDIELWLSGFLHTKLSAFIVDVLNLKDKSEKHLNSRLIKELVEFLKNYTIKIYDFREYKYAEVALGGVDSKELYSNFESKKQKNLFFIGEVLDITGKRGGYNFNFAWCSAFTLNS